MTRIEEKFKKLGIDNAPGQESLQDSAILDLRGEKLEGEFVDFSHGDVDAHPPIPGSLDRFIKSYEDGGKQAYSEYRGHKYIRENVAKKITKFTGVEINPNKNIIITPGTQGALFLAMSSLIAADDKVAILEPDYFDNRKLAEFLEADIYPIQLDYLNAPSGSSGIDFDALEAAFKDGVRVFLFTNPGNPTGAVYSKKELEKIAALAKKYNVTLLADELYSRQIFDNRKYYHMINEDVDFDKLITIMGPSKTESMSGFRLGIAYGSEKIIDRMEKLQAIVSLRAPGYNQAMLELWFDEPKGWLEERIKVHQDIRDDLVEKFRKVEGVKIRPTEGGSYIFPKLPKLDINIGDFVKVLRVHANVIVTVGTEFGPQFDDCIRLNFSQDPKKASDAVDRIIEMIERYRAK
ncbi:pyridoxal phosphate-dependent aminotransferase [Peptoniphilus porci]|uniref:Aspartate aminotransferase n=1 Tax=Peptoniphilus porci TaxID=2652280 RepID=A0A1U7M1D4_9FIRM|nr:pyridoxal phosphate-dependent aminotransferase [Peptoniphilus porci]OLR65366.1 aspartate aminotransferase [Peptoniphilus porci]